jgi:chemotaxis protein methyltransferase CheR
MMNKDTFEAFRKLVYDKAGIALGEKKEALVAARLNKRMHLLNIDTFEDYLDMIKSDTTGNEIVQLLDSISTNVTHFFRENQHFDFITPQIDGWHSQGQRKLRIWSAGCSSGEEPYTIAMTVLEALKGRAADVKILATDLSTKILSKAMSGVYGTKDVVKIPENYTEKYFHKSAEDNQTIYRIIPQCRSLISFQRLNLMNMPYPMKGPFDLIFCRNVMIYFDNDMRKKLLEQYFKLLKVGGYLLVGHAESLTGMLSGFKSVKPSIYMKS